MKNISITIDKKEILEEVSLATAYTGAKSGGDESMFERVATITEDEALLTRLWNGLGGILTEKFKSFIISSEITSGSFLLTLEVSGAYDDSLTSSVKSDINGGVAAGVVAGWFRISFPEKSSEWEKQSEMLLSRAFSKLYHRRRPSRRES